MSLINDMLKDLDGRQADHALEVADSRPSHNTLSHKRLWTLSIVAVFVLVCGALVQFDLFARFVSAPTATEITPDSLVVQPARLQGDQQNVRASVSHETERLASVGENDSADSPNVSNVEIDKSDYLVSKVINNQNNQDNDTDQKESEIALELGQETTLASPLKNASSHISRLLQEAEAALLRDHLMTPSELNAYQLFNSVLLLEPEHPKAKSGLQAIYRRYLTLADQATAASQYRQASLYRQRASLISPLPEGTLMANAIDDGAVKANSTEKPSASIGSAKTAPVPVAPRTTEPTEITADTPGDGKMHIKSVSAVTDADWLAQLRSDPSGAAQQAVLKSLRGGTNLPLTVQHLADEKVFGTDLAGLEQIIRLARISGGGLAYAEAQKAVLQGDYQSAKSYLVEANTQSAAAAGRLRLLSAICQKLRDYQCAAQGYQALVTSQFSSVSDWLGAAVSLDGLQRHNSALSAYQQVLHAPHPNPDIVEYSRRRVAEISSLLLRR